LLATRYGAILEVVMRFPSTLSVPAKVSSAAALAFCALLLVAPSMRADELKLKDGTKIVGTIVGFEENSFKVKTSYGFAEVQKDQVVSITMSDATKTADPPKKSAGGSAPSVSKPAAPTSDPASKTDSAPVASSSTAAAKPPATAVTPSVAKNTAPTPPPAAAPVATPPKPAAPEPMREDVNGNTYTNETYGFRMYKPPDWNLIAGARTILPGSITAMGTDDQNTYLLIGQEPAGKSLANDIDSTEQRLRDIMDNFRPLGEKHITVSGLSVVERHFRGSVDKRDWSGVVVYIPRDARVYTIFGMTLADTDLVQIQENVIARSISSLQFTK
jgi:hypothetical protein